MGVVGGAVVIAVILVVILPVLVLLGGTILCMIFGWLLNEHAEVTHRGSELIDTNV
jgi:hypothetical protein